MGQYFQPGNRGFRQLSSKDSYRDRTGIIAEINKRLDNGDNLICLSLPRRSGKTWQCQTLWAYYDESCDSRKLFDKWEISGDQSYEGHRNRYLAIRLDMAVMMADAMRESQGIRSYVERELKEEAIQLYPELPLRSDRNLERMLAQIVTAKGKPLFFFIDEWDAPIRMAAADPEEQSDYLEMLRSWFKNGTFTPDCVAGAYMTGILPIKKMKGESALTDFKEYTILRPGYFAPFIGFQEEDVKELCKGKVNFEKLEDWYDGYTAGGFRFYNPYTVIQAIDNTEVGPYWPATSAAESLTDYLKLDYLGLTESILTLTAKARVLVDTSRFQNDTVHFQSVDDVLTLLIHLGYLSYDRVTPADMENWTQKEKEDIRRNPNIVFARIPNRELQRIFQDLLSQSKGMPEFARFMTSSVQLLKDTVSMKSKEVAEAFHRLHSTNYAPSLFGSEQSLRSLIRVAYLAYLDEYYQLEEVPSGKGIADTIFIPMPDSVSPPMIVELKWNRSADSALRQILDKQYPAFLSGTKKDILFVGINYDSDSGKHSCKIYKIHREGDEYLVAEESEVAVA